MSLSGKSQAGHVGEDPLPSPLTTRNLRPRLSKFSSRSTPRDASRSQVPLAGPTTQHTHHPNLPAMQSSAEASSASGSGRSSRSQGTDSTRSTKHRGKGRRMDPTPILDEHLKVDQLISNDDIPITSLGLHSHPWMDTAIASSSLGTAGSSSSTHQPDTTHVPVSSPSLRKILHPTNIGFSQRSSPTPEPIASTSSVTAAAAHDPVPHAPAAEPLSEYTCPICFYPPTNATLTPCGHICCGSCLFMAVKSTMQRGAVSLHEANVARCPVCRAPIPGWDGKGGGVIGLKPRTVFAL